MKRAIPLQELELVPANSRYTIADGDILTPLGRDCLLRKRVRIDYISKSVKSCGGPVARVAPRSRVMVVASGRNRSGVLASITRALGNADIREINQSIVDDVFTLILSVELDASMATGAGFERFCSAVRSVGQASGYSVSVLESTGAGQPDSGMRF